MEKVKLLEKRPPERPEDTFVVTVNDSLTHRVFVLNQGALVAWPEYYAALSWSKGGQVFLTREGSQFSSPSGAKKFQVCLIDEESVVIAPTDAPLKRLRIPRAGATSSSLSSARSQP